ncbi:MAG TPA: ABC transporter permease [Stellaceae bacterium]|jgi:NitT/TauT family transport system permease protein|nr:ABC transporter permease [Stellaceae bacterium]
MSSDIDSAAPAAAIIAEPVVDEAAGVDLFRRRVIIARTLLCVGALVVWQAAVSVGLIDAFWISSPVLVVVEMWHLLTSGELLNDIWMTVSEALIAFVVSSVLGVVSGLALSRSVFWDDVFAPIIVALNSLPRIALAPLIILWFGVGVAAKVVTAFTLVYFILLVNTLGGAKNIDNDILTIAQLMGASKRDLLWKVVLPSALPWIFAALSIALTYSLLGVIVAEILASNQGLGYLIAASAGNFNTAGVFAGLVVLAAIAWLFSMAMRKIEARLLRWKPSTASA